MPNLVEIPAAAATCGFNRSLIEQYTDGHILYNEFAEVQSK